MLEGTVVTINDAVVATQLTDGDNPAFFIQSMEGGAYNGIYIFKYDEVDYSPTPGDVISITGEYTEYYGNSQLKVTEAGAITVTDTGAEIVVTDVTEGRKLGNVRASWCASPTWRSPTLPTSTTTEPWTWPSAAWTTCSRTTTRKTAPPTPASPAPSPTAGTSTRLSRAPAMTWWATPGHRRRLERRSLRRRHRQRRRQHRLRRLGLRRRPRVRRLRRWKHRRRDLRRRRRQRRRQLH